MYEEYRVGAITMSDRTEYISRQAEIEKIHRIFSDLNMACAYDMPSFSCNHGKDYKVIKTRYYQGYQRALEDAEARIMDALKDGEQNETD